MWFNIYTRSMNPLTSIFLLLSLFTANISGYPQYDDSDLQIRTSHIDHETWDKVVKKGHRLECAMNHNKSMASTCFEEKVKITSEFTYNDLKKWGWRRDVLSLEHAERVIRPIKKLYESLSILPKHSEYVNWKQNETVNLNGTAYKPTDGNFGNIYNAIGGAVTVEDLENPSNGLHSKKLSHLVKLNKWSDVTFLEWQDLCKKRNVSVKSLKYVIIDAILNKETKNIMREALGVSQDFDNWENYADGKHFAHGSPDFAALLATPFGSRAAWMLIQHKPQLGQKRISNITIFGQEEDRYWRPGMLLEVETI